jgi:hypothetical protein
MPAKASGAPHWRLGNSLKWSNGWRVVAECAVLVVGEHPCVLLIGPAGGGLGGRIERVTFEQRLFHGGSHLRRLHLAGGDNANNHANKDTYQSDTDAVDGPS